MAESTGAYSVLPDLYQEIPTGEDGVSQPLGSAYAPAIDLYNVEDAYSAQYTADEPSESTPLGAYAYMSEAAVSDDETDLDSNTIPVTYTLVSENESEEGNENAFVNVFFALGS